MITKATLNKWARMTDENLHSEARVDVARTFRRLFGERFRGYVVFFEELENRLEKDGCLKMQLAILKEQIFDRMFEDATEFISREEVERIKKSF